MKPRREARFLGAPLFVQVLVLMAGTLITAQVLSLLTIFSLPPPPATTYPVAEVVNTYNGLPPSPEHKSAPLIVVTQRRPPTSTFSNNPDPELRGIGRWMRGHIARQLKPPVSPDDIVIRTAFSRWQRDTGLQRLYRSAVDGETPPFLVAPLKVAVKQPNGMWKVVRSPRQFTLDRWQQTQLVWFLASSFAIAAGAYILARRLSLPLALFADAADRLGRDPRAPPLEVHGSSEIMVAAGAFNNMQERLRRYVEDRTAMVGAIAHDLRTPLTRLRFRIEAAPEDVRGKMSADLDEMEAMISATLSFVRDATQPGTRTKLELSSLLESLTDEMTDMGRDVVIQRSDRVVIEGDPISLKRLFSNLLENALKYGVRARVRVFKDDANAIVEIDDDGPGVPTADLERVFEAFYRREPSRSRETGGQGLGLANVRGVARGHGGEAELVNRPEGGLTARVRLPLPA